MKLTMSDRADRIIYLAGPEEQRHIEPWLDYLRHWDTDPFARSWTVPLDVDGEVVQLFQTPGDYRIFYTVDEASETVHVIEVTTREAIRAFGGARSAVA